QGYCAERRVRRQHESLCALHASSDDIFAWRASETVAKDATEVTRTQANDRSEVLTSNWAIQFRVDVGGHLADLPRSQTAARRRACRFARSDLQYHGRTTQALLREPAFVTNYIV